VIFFIEGQFAVGSLTAMPTVPQIPPDLQADLETMSKIYAEGEN